ncbi:MAG TPA: hypothetical protein VJC16_01010 [Candidatus Nanoarchaeia archaeon]|nr:hypothetical protein [Candidatus Nanoarchaeia archaeon]
MKAQMEIMGIAVVMILVAFGVLFAVRYVFLEQPSSLGAEFDEQQLARQMVTVLLRTSVGRESIQSLIIQCAQGQNPPAVACMDAQQHISSIFSQTLDAWGVKYYFQVQRGNQPVIQAIGQSCPRAKTSAEQPLPLGEGTVRVVLEVCR